MSTSGDLFIVDLGNLDADALHTEVREQVGGNEAVVLLYRPDECVIAIPREPGFWRPGPTGTGEWVDPSAAYEIIAFSQRAELHWVREGKQGRAHLVTESPVPDFDAAMVRTVQVHWPKDSVNYLLWGEPLGQPRTFTDGPSWITLSAARIGAIEVPMADEDVQGDVRDGEFTLKAVEYFAADEEHGNVTFGMQRYVAIEWQKTKKHSGGEERSHG